MLEKTGADGVMVARAAMYDPHIFTELLGGEKQWDKAAVIRGQIAEMLPVYGEEVHACADAQAHRLLSARHARQCAVQNQAVCLPFPCRTGNSSV